MTTRHTSAKSTMVPEMVWGESILSSQEPEDQVLGCFKCLVDGVYTPPTTVYMINGNTLCATHAKELAQ